MQFVLSCPQRDAPYKFPQGAARMGRVLGLTAAPQNHPAMQRLFGGRGDPDLRAGCPGKGRQRSWHPGWARVPDFSPAPCVTSSGGFCLGEVWSPALKTSANPRSSPCEIPGQPLPVLPAPRRRWVPPVCVYHARVLLCRGATSPCEDASVCPSQENYLAATS